METKDNVVPKPSNILEFICISKECEGKNRKMPKIVPQSAILNSLETSVITYSHEKGITCKYCNTYYVLGIASFTGNIQWALQPMQRPSDLIIASSSIIT